MNITVQPLGVLLGLAITGLFMGIGSAVGTSIAKIWLEPHLQKWKDEKYEKKALKYIQKAFKEDEE